VKGHGESLTAVDGFTYGETVPTKIAVVTYEARPWTMNADRQMHHMARAKLVREWRDAFCWLARKERIKPMHQVVIIVQPHLKGKALRDTDSVSPAAKAAIDGLVDARVLIDDGPREVVEIRYLAAIHDSSDSLTLAIYERNP